MSVTGFVGAVADSVTSLHQNLSLEASDIVEQRTVILGVWSYPTEAKLQMSKY